MVRIHSRVISPNKESMSTDRLLTWVTIHYEIKMCLLTRANHLMPEGKTWALELILKILYLRTNTLYVCYMYMYMYIEKLDKNYAFDQEFLNLKIFSWEKA